MRLFRLALALSLLAACSSSSSAEDAPVVLVSPDSPKPSPTPSAAPLTKPTSSSAPSLNMPKSIQTISNGTAILSDLMKKMRDTIGDIIRGGVDPAVGNSQMEEFFLKIRLCAPDEWKDDWEKITGEAINGALDDRGLKPWSASCKKCHDTFREDYKKKHHSRTIPVIP